jgi:Mn2+/Fe2+ NRAMP family transporter
MKQLVDIATTVSFLIAPVIAIVNYKLVIGDDMPAEAKPPVWLRILSISGILFLTAFALYFIWLKVN